MFPTDISRMIQPADSKPINYLRIDSSDDMTFLRWLLIPALALMLLTGSRVRELDTQLALPQAPHRIVSLELAWTPAQAHIVRQAWEEQHLTKTAIASIIRDYTFIIGYSLFLALLVFATGSYQVTTTTRVVAGMAVLAGSCDIVENVFMTQFLQGNSINILFISIPAALKFSLLLVVIGLCATRLLIHLVRRVRQSFR